MLDLNFHVSKAEPLPFAAVPHLVFRLHVAESTTAAEPTPIHSVALRCQIQIEPTRRRYGAGEQQRLLDLFGTPERWGQTLRGLLWTYAHVVIPPFTGSTVVDLPVPCTYDFNVAGVKYFYALEEGEIPLCLLFSGTVFYEAGDGRLQVTQIPWEKEATFRLPVQVWRDMMELYYPNSSWLCLHRDVFDRLYEYKRQRGLPTWEQALESLLARAEERVTP